MALVGNPNSGKTSLFNAISGGHEHVGNYGGVTVGAKSGHRYYRGYRFEVTDLPGTYALSAYTPEERYVRSHIAEKTPDVIINSVVASNLERNLYLTTELIDINPRMVVALNMYDELNSRGSELDYDNLGRMLGVPMVPVEARNGKGIEALLDTVIAVYENQDERVRHIHINMGPVIEEGLRRLKDDMSDYRGRTAQGLPATLLCHEDARRRQAGRGTTARQQPLSRVGGDPRPRGEAHRRSPGRGCRDGFRQPEIRVHTGGAQGDLHPGETRRGLGHEAHRHLRDAQAVGLPDLLFPDVAVFWCTFSLGAYPQEWIDTLVDGSAAAWTRSFLRGRCATCWSTASSAAWGRSSSSCPTS